MKASTRDRVVKDLTDRIQGRQVKLHIEMPWARRILWADALDDGPTAELTGFHECNRREVVLDPGDVVEGVLSQNNETLVFLVNSLNIWFVASGVDLSMLLNSTNDRWW